MGFKEFIIKMLSSESSVSSKRVAGLIGWLVCITICIYCVVLVIEAPVIIETLFYCTAGLLGLDSVTNIWKGSSKKDVTASEYPKDKDNYNQSDNEQVKA